MTLKKAFHFGLVTLLIATIAFAAIGGFPTNSEKQNLVHEQTNPRAQSLPIACSEGSSCGTCGGSGGGNCPS